MHLLLECGTLKYMLKNRIQDLEKEIAELKERMPSHSIPNHMMQRLIELEDELEQLKKDT